ncbi:hypothetical protein F5879DRAFT_478208 [Lentinula edodes]|nr:hypothetical protein F5879DRAFT_478208 [Lentinula edodes]
MTSSPSHPPATTTEILQNAAAAMNALITHFASSTNTVSSQPGSSDSSNDGSAPQRSPGTMDLPVALIPTPTDIARTGETPTPVVNSAPTGIVSDTANKASPSSASEHRMTRGPICQNDCNCVCHRDPSEGPHYAVIVGRNTGVFHEWSEVQPLVTGIPACYTKYPSRVEADASYVNAVMNNRVKMIRPS